MELDKTSYLIGYSDGRDENMKRLYNWIKDENREPAQTFFTAGYMRNIAKQFEHIIQKNEKTI